MLTQKTVFAIFLFAFGVTGFRVFDVNDQRTILAIENENIIIECKKEMQMAYCGFTHPSGKRFSFSGLDLNDGHCAVKIRATTSDSGLWKCHIGGKIVGPEWFQCIHVRVVDSIASIQPVISAVQGDTVTLECATTQGMIPLSYCRFEPPSGIPFSINSDITINNRILDKYYFPQNKSLDRGDCAMTIKEVTNWDGGVWTCGGGLDDGKEHTDTIELDIKESTTTITSSVIGTSVSVAIILFVMWKKRNSLPCVKKPATEDTYEMANRESQSWCKLKYALMKHSDIRTPLVNT